MTIPEDPATPPPPITAPLSDSPVTEETPAKPRLEPTRYGDWELNGKCVDF